MVGCVCGGCRRRRSVRVAGDGDGVGLCSLRVSIFYGVRFIVMFEMG